MTAVATQPHGWFRGHTADTRFPAHKPEPLTDAELRVVHLIAKGITSKEAATELFLSIRTVECHLWRIYKKLKVSNRVQLVLRLSALGFAS